MKIQLQQFLYKLSSYSRPNQTWICGKHAQGYSCENGPNKKGVCRTEYECIPYRQNNSWICTRGPSFGGQCNDGPLPDGQCCNSIVGCIPTMSMRKKRSLFVIWTVFFTVAIVIFLLNSELKDHFFSPGDLSFKHSKVEQCSDCHTVFDHGFVEWVKAAFSGKSMINNSQKCLDCHQFGEHAFKAHGAIPEKLKILSHNNRKNINNDTPEIACFTCHREHHGLEFNMTEITLQNCVICHDLDQSFFKQKHPEFDNYPYRRNNDIIYDHITHAKKYFYNKSGTKLLKTAPETCESCHKIDSSGITMQQGSYEQDCKVCHNEMFEEAESLSVFEIPELAIDGVSDGIWPEDANGVLTPFMVLLLAKDPGFIEAVSVLDDYYDLTVLDKEKTLKLIASIKRLFDDVDKKGAIVFKYRLAQAFDCQINTQGRFDEEQGCKVNESDLDTLVTLLPLNLLCEGKQQWFPNSVKQEEEKIDLSEIVQNESLYCDKSNLSFDLNIPGDEWILDDFSLEYTASSHNDLFIKTWLNLTRHQMQQPVVEQTREQLFKELISEDASVQCTKCHTLESKDGKNFVINWASKNDRATEKGFVRFLHNDHIKYQDKSICNDCHHENTQEDYLKSYEDYDPLTFISNFVTENKDCAVCHQKSMVKKQCQQCHNYHVSETLQSIVGLSSTLMTAH